MSDTKLITLTEAADRLGVEMTTVRRWVRQGKLPGFKLGGRTYRIKASDVDTFLESRRVRPVEAPAVAV